MGKVILVDIVHFLKDYCTTFSFDRLYHAFIGFVEFGHDLGIERSICFIVQCLVIDISIDEEGVVIRCGDHCIFDVFNPCLCFGDIGRIIEVTVDM